MRRTKTAVLEDAPARGVPRRTSPRMLSREIGVLLLILAAQTIMGVVNMDNALGTELMAESDSFHGRPSLNNKNYAYSSSYYSSASSSEKEMPCLDASEGMSSSGRSSGTSDSSDEERDEEEVRAAQLASQLTTPRRLHQLFAQGEDAWEGIFSDPPQHASLPRMRIARMPYSKLAAVFIPCLEDLDGDEMAVEAELAPQPGASAAGGQRLFLGQLRRTGTVPMVRWLVNTVFNAPPGALVSVENRRNTHTQRGKGCAWPTINDAATVERMLAAHHRLFFDAVDGVEGVWLVPEGQEAALQAEIALRGDGASTHQKHMPRGTVVVEVPSATAPSVPAPVHRGPAPAYGCGASAWSAGAPCPPYPTCEAVPPPPRASAPAGQRAGFVPYRVPGVDFVQPGVYRLNPYTAMA